MKTNRMKKAQPLQRSAALATAALLIFAAALVCTGCPGGSGQKNPSQSGGGNTPPAIGSYNAASGTLTVGSATYMMKPVPAATSQNLGVGATLSTDNNGPHTVSLTAYHIGETEVTQELYQAVMGNNPSQFDGTSGKEPAAGEEQSKRPVDTVTWFQCIKFCNKLTDGIAGLGPSERVYTVSGTTVTQNLSKKGFRLPTEAEWEWAAIGGSARHKWAGTNDPSQAELYAWFVTNSDAKTHEVKHNKKANVFGLYDMCGNVAEWCWDWYGDPILMSPADDPTGPTSQSPGQGRVRRGGCYADTVQDIEAVLRRDSTSASQQCGLRIVCRP